MSDWNERLTDAEIANLNAQLEARLHGDEIAALKAEIARLGKIEKAARDWLKAYDDCGPDNGPSLTEHACAARMRAVLEAR